MTVARYSTIDEAVRVFARGDPVIVVDHAQRANTAELIMSAEHVHPANVGFFLEHTSGFLRVAITPERARALDLDLVAASPEATSTPYLTPVDARVGTSTGISAVDRAATCRLLADPRCVPRDLRRPGHVVPVCARRGGVLEQAGPAEAGTELCRLAGLVQAALVSELITGDRLEVLRGTEAMAFAERHDLAIVAMTHLAEHAESPDCAITCSGEARLPLANTTFTAVAYRDSSENAEHLALVHGDPSRDEPPLVRIHGECVTGNVFGSLRCDCSEQLNSAVTTIAAEGHGIILYLRRREGSSTGIGCDASVPLPGDGHGTDGGDTNTALDIPIGGKEYAAASAMLAELGVSAIRLMSPHPDKYQSLERYGIRIVERVPTAVSTPTDDQSYAAIT